MKIGIKTHTCEDIVPNPYTCENLISNYHRCEELGHNRPKALKNWNRMQNAADLGAGGGYFINLRNTHVCYMKFDIVRIFHNV